ncbi:alpha/beta hydrolase [Aestuariirhabdus sp. Z084]|uniref:alpha/beta fold hydrolase n=1 Tax=Aestuariirhabdus haliotis TaxID=2918751 RepID=UPI00201B3ECE|nr:alpha/beta hydrolase [Aestuariirhabdus haliotis]MCL6416621.1 alpha/beta hydrolase [Aestuariirhabdus haliotis]MCL6420656.1 alpha/beta hydrolase [Aestuariirhabdus haliotis]
MKTTEQKPSLPANAFWEQHPGSGIPAHFYHANGFAPGLYQPLLSQLSQQLNISALAMRPTWPDIGLPPKRRDWQLYADDLIAFIEQHCHEPVVGLGHSMGATCTILAAYKRPELFRALVLIEPAMVSRTLARLTRVMPKALMNQTQPAKGTLRKTDTWPDREAFLKHCKSIRGYKRFDDQAFEHMAQHGVVENTEGEFELSFPKSWEAHNYTQPPNVMNQLATLSMPCLAIRGKPSVFFTEALWKEWRRRCPNTHFKQALTQGHLLPLENPTLCHQLINEGLAELNLTVD